MQGQIPTHSPPACRHSTGFDAADNGLGELFRLFGEEYIQRYGASEKQIKLIRNIRICRTPAMGGTVYTCKKCQQQKYVYFGCGNAQCPKCQGIKRLQWQDKLALRLFHCPYQHVVFTMPHELNSLARRNPESIYNCLLRSAWESLKKCCLDPRNLGATPGAVMVLHTFGSDLKYHVHVHALVSFGGLDTNGQWQWPKRKKKSVPFRQIRKEFKNTFLANLSELYPTLDTKFSFQDILSDISQKTWCVHQQPPTTNSKTISDYLGKYINRIGLSIGRFNFDHIHHQVNLTHKDYSHQTNPSEPPPMATKHMNPLVAIHQILQHCLPPYFQKCRYLGLHSNSAQKKSMDRVPHVLKNNGTTVRTIIQLVCAMLGVETIRCDKCGHDQFLHEDFAGDSKWLSTRLTIPSRNKDPVTTTKYNRLPHNSTPLQGIAVPKNGKSALKSGKIPGLTTA